MRVCIDVRRTCRAAGQDLLLPTRIQSSALGAFALQRQSFPRDGNRGLGLRRNMRWDDAREPSMKRE